MSRSVRRFSDVCICVWRCPFRCLEVFRNIQRCLEMSRGVQTFVNSLHVLSITFNISWFLDMFGVKTISFLLLLFWLYYRL